MLKIGDLTPTATQEGRWTDGSIAGGIAPTIILAGWLNAVQDELVNIVESAGIELDKDNSEQVLNALKKLFLSRTEPFADIKADGTQAVAKALANLGLGEAAKRSVGTGTNQIPDMSAFTYTVNGDNSFIVRLPGGIILQGGALVTDTNGSATVSMPVAMSSYYAIASEALVDGWQASGGIYSFITVYGIRRSSASQFAVRSASWRSSDKNFVAQATVGAWLAVGRL